VREIETKERCARERGKRERERERDKRVDFVCLALSLQRTIEGRVELGAETREIIVNFSFSPVCLSDKKSFVCCSLI
jgi:hypothetical protein